MGSIGKFGVTAAIAAMLVSPALAQKAKDTLRIAVHQPISTIDGIFDPSPQTSLTSRMVLDYLINFDPRTKTYVPGLAESWTRIDDRTIELRLRKGIKFHNGQDFDADDVVYTFNYILDPKTVFRFKSSSYGYYDKIEKIDQFTVRISSKDKFAPLVARLTTSMPIFPHKHHSQLKDKAAFGRAPIGTGPYKASPVDPVRGVVLELNPDYKHGNAGRPAGKIKRIAVRPITDEQTRVAQLMVGALDLIYDVQPDVAENLRTNPILEVTNRPTNAFAYIMLDVPGRSGQNYFKDKRVREAVLRAIDRKALVNALQTKEIAEMPLQAAMCHPWNIGCSWSLEPPSHDLEAAKKLMTEAGYPNGFNLSIGTWGPSRPATEAVAGQLRRIGIRVSVDAMALPAFVKKRGAGELTAIVALWDNGVGAPDVESTAGFFYSGGDRDYNGDKELIELYRAGQQEFDEKKRAEIYRKLFDKVTAERYSMPLIPLAASVVHSKDVKMPPPGSSYTEGFTLNLLEWK